MDYNYREEVKDDVLEYIRENIEFEDFEDLDELAEKLNDECWIADSVTGNASGSYTFSTWEAEENIAHNWDLLEEALFDFGYEKNPIEMGAEWCDVIIRCYVLGTAIAEALKEIEDYFNKAHEGAE